MHPPRPTLRTLVGTLVFSENMLVRHPVLMPCGHEALGTKEQGAVRFSFSWFTTEEEIDVAIRAVAELAAEN